MREENGYEPMHTRDQLMVLVTLERDAAVVREIEEKLDEAKRRRNRTIKLGARMLISQRAMSRRCGLGQGSVSTIVREDHW